MSGLSLGNGLTVGGASPTGAAGGDLSGTYPNPTVASIGGKAVTLGGALTTSGAFGLTLTLTGTTNVTLPTSGTLAVLGANTFVGVQTLPVGAASAPSLTIGTGAGLYQSGTNILDISINGTNRNRFSSTGFSQGSGQVIGWSSATAVSTNTTGLSRVADGVLAIGTGAASAIDGTLRTALVQLGQGTAPVSGGSATFGVRLSSSNVGLYVSNGAPTFSAAKGSICMNTAGSGTSDRLYVNTNGTTGWTSITSAT